MQRYPPELRRLFTPQRVLGEGGRGVVYLATSVEDGSLRAVKVLHEALAEAEAARFEQEARLLGALRHPNIAAIHAWGNLKQGYWLSLEYLEGQTFREFLAEHGPLLSGRRMLLWVAQAARALEYAHGRGVLHRDVKPDNLFLVGSDEVKLLDFGMAKADHLLGSSVRTQQGMLLGTPAYMAPERARGEAACVETDVYALAIVTYELLGGAPPFTGEPMEVLSSHLKEEPPPLPANVPREIDRAVRAALAKKPVDRPRSAREFLRSLRDAAKTVVAKRRRGETPREVEQVSDFDDGVLASRVDNPVFAKSSESLADGLPPTSVLTASEISEVVTRSMRAPSLGARARDFSRRLVAPGLLAPKARRGILGGAVCLVTFVLLFLLWPSPTLPTPKIVNLQEGTHGVVFDWSAPAPVSPRFYVLPVQESPASRGKATDVLPRVKDEMIWEELQPGLEYSIWAAYPDQSPRRLTDFRTAASFRLESIDFKFRDGAIALKVVGSPAWRGTLLAEDPEDELKTERILPLGNLAQEIPELRVGTAGSPLRECPEFRSALLEACRRPLESVRALEVSEALLRSTDVDYLEGTAYASEELRQRFKKVLDESTGVRKVAALRPLFRSLLGAPEIDLSARFEFTRQLAPLALIDGTLEALRVEGLLGSGGELASATEDLFREVKPRDRYSIETPPPPPALVEFRPVLSNNLHPHHMPPEVVLGYSTLSRKIYGDVAHQAEMRFHFQLSRGQLRGARLGLISRAALPENVVYLEINDKAVLPMRWNRRHGAKPFRGLLFDAMGKGMGETYAPLTPREFRLPPGLLQEGENVIRLYCENAREKPDFWLPVIHGVYLWPDV